jgi:hypothetical protein
VTRVLLYGLCFFVCGGLLCFAFMCWQFLSVVGLVVFWLVFGVMEEFVVRVFKGGKVTVPKRLRELFSVEDGDYVRLGLVEVLKKADKDWVRRRV